MLEKAVHSPEPLLVFLAGLHGPDPEGVTRHPDQVHGEHAVDAPSKGEETTQCGMTVDMQQMFGYPLHEFIHDTRSLLHRVLACLESVPHATETIVP